MLATAGLSSDEFSLISFDVKLPTSNTCGMEVGLSYFCKCQSFADYLMVGDPMRPLSELSGKLPALCSLLCLI